MGPECLGVPQGRRGEFLQKEFSIVTSTGLFLHGRQAEEEKESTRTAMSTNDIRFLPYEEALKIVAAIQEEEDIHQANHRILTVYNHDDKEICWYDFDEVMNKVGGKSKEEKRELVTDYILRHLPDWALDV